jgi:hypothetical protein
MLLNDKEPASCDAGPDDHEMMPQNDARPDSET